MGVPHLPVVINRNEHLIPLPDRASVAVTYNGSLRTHGTASNSEAAICNVRNSGRAAGVQIVVRDSPRYRDSVSADVWLSEDNLRACLAAIEKAKQDSAPPPPPLSFGL